MAINHNKSDGVFYSIAVIVSAATPIAAIMAGIYADRTFFGRSGAADLKLAALAACTLTLFLMQITRAHLVGKRRLLDVAYACFITVIMVNLALMALPYFDIVFDLSPPGLAVTAGTQFFMLCCWAYSFHRLYFAIFPKRPALVLADSTDSAAYCADKIRRHSREFHVAAALAVSDFAELPPDCGALIAFRLDPVKQNELCSLCYEHAVQFCVVPEIWELAVHKGRELQFGEMMAFRLQAPYISKEAAAFKRAFDILFSGLALLVTALPMLLFALIVFLQDKSSPFYTQERLTKDGRVFNLIKLRTMVPDAEQDSGPVLAAREDPRITRFGGFLRRTRLDELPQFINVLRGDMSVVGPRPERKHFNDLYSQEVPHFSRRLNVKAGITGMAHVYGRYDTPPEERVKLDLYYILNYSPMLDFRILLDTARIMLSRSYSEGVKGKPVP